MWDPALIDLFRSEVETHLESLSAALLELERNPGDTSRIDEMMRAAHSIKGASRVVGVDPAVRAAHVMEDCFVAAQKGTLQLRSADVDVLLRGVDLLTNIAAATSNPDTKINDAFEAGVREFVTELELRIGRKEGNAIQPAPPLLAGATGPASTDLNQVTIIFPALLDAAAAERIRQQLLAAVESQCATIHFDLARTEDLDIRGLALLAAVPRYLANHPHAKIRLAAVSIPMQTVLRVSGLAGQYDTGDRAARGTT